MKLSKSTILFIFVFLFSGSLVVYAQDANTLLQEMDKLMLAFKDKQGTVKIVLTNLKSGKEKVREAEMKQKGKDYRLYRYTQPEKQAGIATLSLPDDIMWMYMPAFAKPKKISLLAKSQAFTGTDFSYEDMESKPYLERYTPTLLETKENSYELELIPISDKSKYSKIILNLHKEHSYPVTMEYFNKGNQKIKESSYSYKKEGKYWYAEEVMMTSLKKEHSTKIIMTDVKFDQGIPDEVFAVENLAPVKEKTEEDKE